MEICHRILSAFSIDIRLTAGNVGPSTGCHTHIQTLNGDPKLSFHISFYRPLCIVMPVLQARFWAIETNAYANLSIDK